MPPVLPALGCLTLASVMLFLVLMPFVFVDLMHQALSRLHLAPGAALFAVLAILIGSLINLPVHRIEREELQVVHPFAVWGPWWLAPSWQRVRRETVIAVNVGGCVVPTLIAAWQLPFLAASGPALLAATALVSAANITACYFAARPVPGVGIMMPGLISPAVSLLFTWIVLPMDAPERASVAFVAGILGPLVGADLLHLKEIEKVSTGLLSIGGAGTFDGIVLSGVLAALLA